MKSRIIFLWIAFSTAIFAACDNDDSDDNEDLPGNVVIAAFQAKYPGATAVTWESQGNFQEADFDFNGREYEAWFNNSGVWLQAEYTQAYTSIPAAVKDYIANSINYPPTLWTPEASTEVVERKNYPVRYAVELEKGQEDVTIWIDAEAYIHREIIEDFSGNDIPQPIRSFIALKYKQGLILEVGKWKDGKWQANVLDDSEAKEVFFNRSMEWQYTEWPVLLQDVPQVVKAVLTTPAYEIYTVRNVSYRQYPQADRYHFVLTPKQQPGMDTALDVGLQGNIIIP